MCIRCVVLYICICIVVYCTPGVGVCVVGRCGFMYYLVLFIMCGFTFCDVHYVYVYVIEEKKIHRALVGYENQPNVCIERIKEKVRTDEG